MRLRSPLEAQVAAGAPGALARIEAPGFGVARDGAAGWLVRGESRALRPDDAVNARHIDRWPVVAALCQRPRDTLPAEHPDRSNRP